MLLQTRPHDPTEAAGNLSPTGPAPFREPHAHVDNFLSDSLAREMRDAIDRHFAEPYKQKAEHQVWNYWYVPDMYTFLRTSPDKVLGRDLLERFYRALTTWAWNVLGLGNVTYPFLSLYVNGCSQSIHNDATNGRFGYVYSLTRNQRDTRGGETIVFHEGDLFRSRLRTMTGGRGGLYEMIEPAFNRLAIFDDRMPHGVNRIEGSMDPVHARIVLHGHISETGPAVQGPLPPHEVGAAVEGAANEALSGFDMATDPHGPVVVRISILPNGDVAQARLVLDRLAFPDGTSTEGMAEAVVEAVKKLRFPEAAEPSEAVVPVLVGGPLPWVKT
ncbi:MAG TPA: hypothetical protein VGX37_05640 [Allosphingosinicella sp.]|nr:hypothetical protein [Allosphingosinicella sp.]